MAEHRNTLIAHVVAQKMHNRAAGHDTLGLRRCFCVSVILCSHRSDGGSHLEPSKMHWWPLSFPWFSSQHACAVLSHKQSRSSLMPEAIMIVLKPDRTANSENVQHGGGM